MTDKILKEAFDKLTALEEGVGVAQGEDIMDGIGEFEEIQHALFEVIERLQDALRAYSPNDLRYWESYGLAQLKIVAGSDEYATHDKSINDLIKGLKELAQSADDGYDDDEFGDEAHAAERNEDVEEALSPEMEKRKQADQAAIAQRKSFDEPRRRPRRSSRRGTGSFDTSITQR